MPAPQPIPVPHDGVLMLVDTAIRCFVAEDGDTYVSAKGVVRVVTGEAMTTWAEFVRTVPDLAPEEGDALLVSVLPKRGPAVEAVPATALPELCNRIIDAYVASDAPTDDVSHRAGRCMCVLGILELKGMSSLGRGVVASGGAA